MTTRTKPRRPVVVLRPVPGRSAVHELWAGTKIIAVSLFAVLLAVMPSWSTIGIVATFVLATARLAGVPRSAVPSAPRWLGIVLLAGAAAALLAGGEPSAGFGPVKIEVGGLLDYLNFTALALVLLGLCSLVSWTTEVSELAPAVSVLGRPLTVLRLPVDDWTAALALALRAFPMLSHEFRVLLAARRLRPAVVPGTRRGRCRKRSGEVVDLLTAAMVVSLRRADEMGDAITARGGAGQISARPSRPTSADAVALAIVAALCALAL